MPTYIMYKFLETYNHLGPNLEETENLNRLISRNKIESVIRKLPRNLKEQDQPTSQVNSTKLLKKN